MGERAHMDHYPTPAPLAEACVQAIARAFPEFDHWKGPSIIEPSAGDGAVVRPLRAQWPNAYLLAVDVRDTEGACIAVGASAFVRGDWWSYWEHSEDHDQFGLIVGNPPYSLAASHADAALRYGREGVVVAFLLRMAILSSKKRLPFWRTHPLRYLAPIVERPSFTGGGSDNSDYGLFVWQKGFVGRGELLEPISWKDAQP